MKSYKYKHPSILSLRKEKSYLMTSSTNKLVAMKFKKTKGLAKLLTDPYVKVYILSELFG